MDDLTGRARVRDAALAQFAKHGVAGATLQMIAEEAGVSAGLVRHHFGSKDGLREACDAYVLEFLRHEAKEGITEGAIADPDYIARAYQAAPPVMAYLARTLVDGSPTGENLFDGMVAVTEEVLADLAPAGPSGQADPHTQAAVLVTMKLGVIVLHGHLSRALGADALSPRAWPQVSRAMLDLLSPHLVGDELTERIRAGLDQHEERNRGDA